MPYTEPVQSIDQEDVQDMQVDKYKLGGVIFTRTTGNWYCTDDDETECLAERTLLILGATPLIESEPEPGMFETDIETLASNLVWSNGTVKPGYLASTLSEIHMRLNALQKGSK